MQRATQSKRIPKRAPKPTTTKPRRPRTLSHQTLKTFTSTVIPPLLDDTNPRHKGSLGRVVIVGGCKAYTGAPYFASRAAMATGADLSFVLCEESAAVPIKCYDPNLIVVPCMKEDGNWDVDYDDGYVKGVIERASSVVIGCGLGREERMLRLAKVVVDAAKASGKWIVLDGDALWHLGNENYVHGYRKLIITPNVNEMRVLCDAYGIDGNGGIQSNVALCKKLKCIGVFKGVQDVVCDGDDVVICDVGSSKRRCGGQGDIVCGTIGTFAGWHDIMQAQGNDVQKGIGIAEKLAGACSLVRRASNLAYKEKGRSHTATDILDKYHEAFSIFEETNRSTSSYYA